MYYPAIYGVKKGYFAHAESLMRIPHSPIGPIYPDEFIPVAEETGLIVDITYVVLDKVCRFINRLTEQNIPIESVHVNFSAMQFSQQDLEERVLEIIRRNIPPCPPLKSNSRKARWRKAQRPLRSLPSTCCSMELRWDWTISVRVLQYCNGN